MPDSLLPFIVVASRPRMGRRPRPTPAQLSPAHLHLGSLLRLPRPCYFLLVPVSGLHLKLSLRSKRLAFTLTAGSGMKRRKTRLPQHGQPSQRVRIILRQIFNFLRTACLSWYMTAIFPDWAAWQRKFGI